MADDRRLMDFLLTDQDGRWYGIYSILQNGTTYQVSYVQVGRDAPEILVECQTIDQAQAYIDQDKLKRARYLGLTL